MVKHPNYFRRFFRAISLRPSPVEVHVDVELQEIVDVQVLDDTSQVIFSALDALQDAHPYIKIALLPLKVAIEMEITRRENAAKIVALKGLMLDTMSTLQELSVIRSPKKSLPGGLTIEERLTDILEHVSKDIDACNQVCETYMVRAFLVRLFAGSVWDLRLSRFVTVFDRRRKQIKSALMIHNALTLNELMQQMKEVNSFLGDFSGDTTAGLLELRSPKEREMDQFVEKLGGSGRCMNDPNLMDKVRLKANEGTNYASKTETSENPTTKLIDSIKKEIALDIDQALEKHAKIFSRKYDAVRERLDVLEATLIKVIRGGHHERIDDADLKMIWQDMGFKASVKARHFIAAVRDHFYQKYGTDSRKVALPAQVLDSDKASSSDSSSVSVLQGRPKRLLTDNTRWAIKYITLTRLHSMLEAFDTDMSGWISVKEANDFARNCPPGHSLLEWLAYWATGFRIVSAQYSQLILGTRTRTIELSNYVLPCNRGHVREYLGRAQWSIIDCLVCGALNNWQFWQDDSVVSRFDTYIRGEEKRLRDGLESLEYYIDADNSLRIITGTDRLELCIFPLLHLLLRRHEDIMRLACDRALDAAELSDAMEAIMVIGMAIHARIDALSDIFLYQKLGPDEQFGISYDGMFSVAYRLFKGKITNTDPVLAAFDGNYWTWVFHDKPKSTTVNPEILRHPEPVSSEEAEDDARLVLHHRFVSCDSCGDYIQGARYRCLVCRMDSNSLDLCTACNCNAVDNPQKGLSHLPTHDMLMTMRLIPFLHGSRVLRHAKETVSVASSAFFATEAVTCFVCEEPVARPCWYCTECPGNHIFICTRCAPAQDVSAILKPPEEVDWDAEPSGVDKSPIHRWWHVLVKVHGAVGPAPAPNITEQLVELTERFAALEQTLHAQNALILDIKAAVGPGGPLLPTSQSNASVADAPQM